PSCAFFSAISNPRICPRIFSEIARPAASSPARLIFSPEESFSNELCTLLLFAPSFTEKYDDVNLRREMFIEFIYQRKRYIPYYLDENIKGKFNMFPRSEERRVGKESMNSLYKC